MPAHRSVPHPQHLVSLAGEVLLPTMRPPNLSERLECRIREGHYWHAGPPPVQVAYPRARFCCRCGYLQARG